MDFSKHPIFQRMQLNPASLRTVADRRYGDAIALRQTNDNARANGAMYLAGFVIECLLKAHALMEHSWLKNAVYPVAGTDEQKQLWSLCYRSHDLDEISGHLPKLRARLAAHSQIDGSGPLLLLQQVAASWTIFARYSTRTATMKEASEFINVVKELKKCL